MNLCGTRTLPPPCFSIEVKVFWRGGVNWPQGNAREKEEIELDERKTKERERNWMRGKGKKRELAEKKRKEQIELAEEKERRDGNNSGKEETGPISSRG
ncbi:hypothetical protein TNCV_319231 [Trichonephila clavipes]|nr:hypothetical protein TNCV_319231 [Trichonephila clavipes]